MGQGGLFENEDKKKEKSEEAMLLCSHFKD